MNAGLSRAEASNQVAKDRGISGQSVDDYTAICAPSESLDAPVNLHVDNGGVRARIDTLEAPSVGAGTLDWSSKRTLSGYLGKLQENHKAAITAYLTCGDGTAGTMTDIGKAMSVSRQRANVVFNEAVGILRERLSQDGLSLADFIG